jgi:hypothetical protein
MFWHICAIIKFNNCWCITDYQQVLNLMYEFPKDDTNVPKQATVLEDRTLKCDG